LTTENVDGVRTRLNDELIPKRANIWDQMKELVPAEGGMSAEDAQTYDNAETELEEVDTEIARLERFLKANSANEAREEERTALLVDNRIVSSVQVAKDEAERQEITFDKWLRGGMKALDSEEQEFMQTRHMHLADAESRAQGTGAISGAAGGYTVPEGFWNQIVEATLAFGGIRNAGVFEFSTGTGNDLPIPSNDDTGNVGALITENTQVSEQDTAFGQKTMKAWIWTSKIIRVSLALLQDSAFDLPAFLARKLGERIGRAQAGYFITGTGSNQPEGILTNITTGHTTVATQTTSLTYDDFVNLEHSVDPTYRIRSEYVMSDDALRAARLIKDENGLPIWAPGMVTGVPSTVNGYAYTIDNNMPDVVASSKPIVFGDLSHYWVRSVLGVQTLRLDERYADFLQVGFLCFSRLDARPVDAGNDPYKSLTMVAA